MKSTAIKLNSLLENLQEDYDKAVSYIEFLIATKKRERLERKLAEDETDIEAVVSSLTGAIPNTGKSLEEYRSERLKKYENPY